MPQKSREIQGLRIEPVTKTHWRDLESLFGERGACGGCWCMSWRLLKKDFDAQKGEGNKAALKKMVTAGKTPGLIAYINDEPIGWISVAPREEFARLDKARSLKPIDDQPVWSVVCFFVAKQHRRQGVGVELLKGAIEYVRKLGGKIVEGYPSVPKGELPDPFIYTGTLSGFLRAGFKEVARPSDSRAIVRCEVS
jgi:GNAT superfamily N-acetyltransferase